MNKTFTVTLVAFILCSILLPPGLSGDEFPDFITKTGDYYITRIGKVPHVDPDYYRLEVKGFVMNPRSFTLDELSALEMVKLPLTVECIGNSPNGALVSTAIWEGFNLYELLVSLGIDERATGVRYRAADGYYASHTLDQLKTNNVIGALYMNDEVITPRQGYPLRILNPGYYGVKQPAWVTKIEVIDRPIKDYWEDRGWDCSPPMSVDSKIFFPKRRAAVRAGEFLEIGGAAFGGTRVIKVEVTTDGGVSWKDADIVRRLDADNVWVFWKTAILFENAGQYQVNVRATDIHGNVQQEDDPKRYDGKDDWPVLQVRVTP
jgi:DMSO/TMAO reductase YedYZ molybdopterin-dependent catalytic subunit